MEETAAPPRDSRPPERAGGVCLRARLPRAPGHRPPLLRLRGPRPHLVAVAVFTFRRRWRWSRCCRYPCGCFLHGQSRRAVPASHHGPGSTAWGRRSRRCCSRCCRRRRRGKGRRGRRERCASEDRLLPSAFFFSSVPSCHPFRTISAWILSWSQPRWERIFSCQGGGTLKTTRFCPSRALLEKNNSAAVSCRLRLYLLKILPKGSSRQNTQYPSASTNASRCPRQSRREEGRRHRRRKQRRRGRRWWCRWG